LIRKGFSGSAEKPAGGDTPRLSWIIILPIRAPPPDRHRLADPMSSSSARTARTARERDRSAPGKPSPPVERPTDRVMRAIDFAGTFVFAVEGALAAVRAHLDLLGVLVLSFTVALGGGIRRDRLIGAVPPLAIRDWRYPLVAFAGGASVIALYGLVQEVPLPVLVVLDAAGLSLFAVAGATKALSYGIHPFPAVLLGTITGVGGGTIRDIMLAQVPIVLRADVYATAAMAGAAVMVLGIRLGWRRLPMSILGGLVCFALRMVSVWQHWNLPGVTPR
jgi:uncharacterized membrane protein YeiH